MSIYFVKQDNRLFRFSSFFEVENYTGRDRNVFTKSLAKTLKTIFPEGELTGQHGAVIKGWVDLNGEVVPSLTKGNKWEPYPTRRKL
jgi:hypothetical protein